MAGTAVELFGYTGMFLIVAAMVGCGLLLAFFNWSMLIPPVPENINRG